MTGDAVTPNGHVEDPRHSSEEEGHSLLRNPFDDSDDLVGELHPFEAPPTRPAAKRQSSLSQPRPDGTPRTTNRVRFDVENETTGPVPPDAWMDEEDYLHSPRPDAPLLTDITPPSDSPFLSDAFQPEDHLPNARPKSSKLNAIMNMANSIIGAGESTPA
jgi:solute carrier family 38 (sodium-coupled neutral amino acid transporter), member 11